MAGDLGWLHACTSKSWLYPSGVFSRQAPCNMQSTCKRKKLDCACLQPLHKHTKKQCTLFGHFRSTLCNGLDIGAGTPPPLYKLGPCPSYSGRGGYYDVQHSH